MPAIDIDANAPPLIPWMSELLGQLAELRQRQLVVLQGPLAWCDAQLEALLPLVQSSLLFSSRARFPGAIPPGKAGDSLGGEASLVALDLFDGIDPDLLCICAGLVRAGGVLLLLAPTLDEWASTNDRYACWQDGSASPEAQFARYFFAALEADQAAGKVITPAGPPSSQVMLPPLDPTPIERGTTRQQARCLQRLEDWLDSSPGGIALLRARRGRGKSTCLGILVERLGARCRVLVTAKSRRAAAALLRVAGEVDFVAPDRLVQTLPPADLVIVDEAAMIPQALLRQLERHYDHLAMATTDGGYEGTGRGFMLRFVAELESAGLVQLELDDPVRWCGGDYLEKWLDRVLIQDPPLAPALPAGVAASDCELELVEDIGSNFALLGQVYRLLSEAHYRSRPSDLRMLMENPDLALVVARVGDRVVGAVLLNHEGGFDPALCREVFLGQRRPRGHLLAQMLCAQAGIERFAGHRGLRVQRIAVSEAWRRQGLGTRLLKRARDFARRCGADYLGASFALDAPVAAFWRQAGFELVHVSFAQGKSSGNHSIAVIDALSDAVGADVARLRGRVNAQLPVWMAQFLQFMDAPQVVALLRYSGFETELSDLDTAEVEAFTQGHRGFELGFAALQRYVMQAVAASCEPVDSLLVEKAIQNRPWERLRAGGSDDGRKALQRRLRDLVEALPNP